MKIRRRGQNEGSIHKRSDGRWEARLNLGWIDGRRVRKSFFARTREEVAKALAAAKSEHDKGLPVPHGRETLESFLNAWLVAVRATIKPRTWESYELYVRRHAIPVIGNILLSALRPEHIRSLLARKLEQGLSPQSVIHLRTILNTAIKQAVADRALAWNPVTSVKRPKMARKRFAFTPFTSDQARKFLQASEDSRLGAMFAVALGLRRAELMGLRWIDVDLDRRTLRVEQTIQRLRKKIAPNGEAGFLTAEPKTNRSRRQSDYPTASIVPMIRRHRVKQTEERLQAGAAWRDTGSSSLAAKAVRSSLERSKRNSRPS